MLTWSDDCSWNSQAESHCFIPFAQQQTEKDLGLRHGSKYERICFVVLKLLRRKSRQLGIHDSKTGHFDANGCTIWIPMEIVDISLDISLPMSQLAI